MSAKRPQADAFVTFFRDEHPKLVALGLAWTGDPDVARELAQEALVRAHGSWGRLAELDVPGAWIRRVMINLLIDAQRGRRRSDALRRRLGPPAHVPGPVPSDDRWWHAVRSLPDRERAAITLHYLEELPIADVASILKIAPGTVKASLSHARAKLRAILTDTEDDR